jgi:glycosyltransferase involved in cell wall biosynthesis
MHVFYDDQIFQIQSRGGISRYICTLAQGLARSDAVTVTLFGGISRNEHLTALPALPALRTIYARRRDRLRINTQIERLSRLWRRLAFLSARRRLRPIVYHPSYYVVDRFIAQRADAMIVTFHDLIPEWLHQKSAATKPDRFLARRQEAVQWADAILAISDSTRQDLERHFPGAGAKTTVVHLASSLAVDAGKLPPLPPLPFKRFFLFVGNREDYKNGCLALCAMTRLQKHFPEVGMLFFGGKPLAVEEQRYVSDHNLSSCIQQSRGDDALLAACYQQAVALVYPSTYEGFGLPVLEAMECGCPVITVRATSLPEVGGEAAIYIDPAKPESLLNAMLGLLTNDSARNEAVRLGKVQCAKFSWSRTVEETRQVYACAAAGKTGA